MMQTLGEAAAIVGMVASLLVALSVIAGRVAMVQRAVARWVDATIGEVVERRLTTRNGGTSLMDSLDRVEEHTRRIAATQADVSDRVDRLAADVARQSSSDVARDVRIQALERQLDTVTAAILRES